MKIERKQTGVLKITAHASELATLTAAARWALEGGPGELPEEARTRLLALLKGYEAALQHAAAPARPAPR